MSIVNGKIFPVIIVGRLFVGQMHNKLIVHSISFSINLANKRIILLKHGLRDECKIGIVCLNVGIGEIAFYFLQPIWNNAIPNELKNNFYERILDMTHSLV